MVDVGRISHRMKFKFKLKSIKKFTKNLGNFGNLNSKL